MGRILPTRAHDRNSLLQTTYIQQLANLQALLRADAMKLKINLQENPVAGKPTRGEGFWLPQLRPQGSAQQRGRQSD